MSYDRKIPFDPKLEFAERLVRIEQAGLNTNRTLYVGCDEQFELPPGIFFRHKSKRRLSLPILLMVGIVVAVVAMLAIMGR